MMEITSSIGGEGLNRRSLMARALMLMGASMTPSLIDEALAAPRKKAKRILSPAQFKTLSAVADTIVPKTDTPGAVETGVAASLDGLLANWASASTRKLLIGAITDIDGLAKTLGKKSFAALTPAARLSALTDFDKAALKPVPRKDKLTGLAAMMGPPSVANAGYALLKDLIVSLHYASEAALTRGELVYEHVPGEWQPSLKITPGMRPFASVGLL